MAPDFCARYSFCRSFCGNPIIDSARVTKNLAKSLAKSAFTADSDGAAKPNYTDSSTSSYASTLAPL